MLFVVCRDGVPVKSFSEPMLTWDAATLKLKQLYISEQSQEIYMRTENSFPQWFQAEFKFQVVRSGMHPKQANYSAIAMDKLPDQLQMQLLMGAL